MTDSLHPWAVTQLECGYTLLTRAHQPPPEKCASVDFEIYESLTAAEDGTILYPDGNGGFVEHVAQAPRYASGFLRFDGCMNLTVEDDAMQHFCGRGAVYEWAAALDAVYDIAAELMPEHAELLELDLGEEP